MFNWLLNSVMGTFVATFIISMVPIVELRGGVPFGVGNGLPLWLAFTAAVLGNMLPIPFILLFLERIFDKMRNYKKTKAMVEKFERKAHINGRKVEKYKTLGLFILVAIPLPGTGAWTGALVASVLKVKMKVALPTIFLGVCAAGIVMLLLSHGVVSLL